MKTNSNITTSKWWVIALSLVICHLSYNPARAQQYVGSNGLIHVPTAEMDSAGVARIGAHYVEKHMIPDGMMLTPEKEKFNSLTNYLTITPFRWIQASYGYTLWRFHYGANAKKSTGFYTKDRYFSVRLNVLYETKYLPSVVVGGNDVWGSRDNGQSGSNYYRNYYVAVSKHLDLGGHEVAGHLAYRRWKRDYNHKWNGVVGGLTYRPSFYRPLRLIGEFDGNEVNMGADCLLFKHFLLQVSLQDMKYVSGGLGIQLNLL